MRAAAPRPQNGGVLSREDDRKERTMAGALTKAMVYLGLKEEVDRYDDEYEEYDEYRPEAGDERRSAPEQAAVHPPREMRGSTAVALDEDVLDEETPEQASSEPRRPRGADEPTPIRRSVALARPAVVEEDDAKQPRHAEVTPLPRRVPAAEVVNDVEVTGVHRITTIHPRTYNEAKKVGEAFREGTPVIMNLSDLDDADAKRLVDFAAGLVFGLSGSIERVTNKVFLLSPANVEVTSSDSQSRTAGR